MKTNIPPPKRIGDLSDDEQDQVKTAFGKMNQAIRSCLLEDVPPGVIINVLLSEAARIIAYMPQKDRMMAARSMRANFDEMVEECAEEITRRHRPNGR